MGKPTVEDYTAIRMVAERYVDAVNRFDAEAWGQTWAPDGEWNVGEVHKGREVMVPSGRPSWAASPTSTCTSTRASSTT